MTEEERKKQQRRLISIDRRATLDVVSKLRNEEHFARLMEGRWRWNEKRRNLKRREE